MKIKSFLAAAVSTAGILTLSSPASAVIYDWQFINENGSFTTTTPPNQDIVAGFVEFNDADVASGRASAIDFQITSVTNLPNGSDPFLNDGGIELNQNLIPVSRINIWSFSGGEVRAAFRADAFDNSGDSEDILLEWKDISFWGNFGVSEDSMFIERDSSTLTFKVQDSASVPFEFSPTLGLVLAGSFFAGSRWLKHRFK